VQATSSLSKHKKKDMLWTAAGGPSWRWYLASCARFACALVGFYEFARVQVFAPRTVVVVLDPLCAYEYLWSRRARDRLVDLIEAAADRGVPVLLTRWSRTVGAVADVVDRKRFWSDFLRDAEPDLLPEIEPYGSALHCVRSSNAFAPIDDTDRSHLLTFIRAQGYDTVVLAGCWTEACVYATAVAASEHGLRAVVARRACAGHALAARWSLACLDARCADVVDDVAF
jgi:nicotinamidase-related amidase